METITTTSVEMRQVLVLNALNEDYNNHVSGNEASNASSDLFVHLQWVPLLKKKQSDFTLFFMREKGT